MERGGGGVRLTKLRETNQSLDKALSSSETQQHRAATIGLFSQRLPADSNIESLSKRCQRRTCRNQAVPDRGIAHEIEQSRHQKVPGGCGQKRKEGYAIKEGQGRLQSSKGTRDSIQARTARGKTLIDHRGCCSAPRTGLTFSRRSYISGWLWRCLEADSRFFDHSFLYRSR